MNAFVLTSPLAGVMLLTRRQPFYPSAAHDKFFSICTAFGGYTKFGIAPFKDYADKCLRPTTVARYHLLMPRINAAIGHIHLDKLQPHHIMSLYDSLSERGIREDGRY